MPEARYVHLVKDMHLRNLMISRVNSAIHRCHNPTNNHYKNYGGRGIKVYEPWRRDKIEFFKYLMTLPGWDDPSLCLDREDNEKGYEPGNLRFIPEGESIRNRRQSKRVSIKPLVA